MKYHATFKAKNYRQIAFLSIIANIATLPSVHAATIYKCKQANGKLAYQEIPCVTSDVQTVVKQTTRIVPSKSVSVSTPASSDPEKTEETVCRQTGVKIFDPTREQQLQHPHSAFILCQKILPSPMNKEGICLNTCIQGWVGEYKKKYLGKTE